MPGIDRAPGILYPVHRVGARKAKLVLCLPGAAGHLRLSKRQVMISREMVEDLRGIWDDFSSERWAPLTVSPSLQVPGQQGASSDASGPIYKGWSAHAFGAFAHWVWAARTRLLIEQRRLSINALELLAGAAAVVLIDRAGGARRSIRAEMRQHHGLYGCQLRGGSECRDEGGSPHLAWRVRTKGTDGTATICGHEVQ